jgi:hypothetical protein
VKVGAANPAGPDGDKNFSKARLLERPFTHDQGGAELFQNHRARDGHY